MPKLMLSTTSELPKDGSLRVAIITWNIHNKAPKTEDVNHILDSFSNADGSDVTVDAVIISAQEETRETAKSLGAGVKNALGATNALCAHFDTRTGIFSPGRVSHTIISNHDVKINRDERVQIQESSKAYKAANKGGLGVSFNVAGHTVRSIAVHLDSSSLPVRFSQGNRLISQLEVGVKTFDDLFKKATEAFFMSGDFNQRDLQKPDDASSIYHPPAELKEKNPMLYLNVRGFTEAGKRVSDTYLKKGASTTSLTGSFNSASESSGTPKASSGSSGEEASILRSTIPPIRSEDAPPPRTPRRNKPFEAEEGKLDLVFYRGSHCLSESVVEGMPALDGKTTSDHKPVVAVFNIPAVCAADNDIIKKVKEFLLSEAKSINKGSLNQEEREALKMLNANVWNITTINTDKDQIKLNLLQFYNELHKLKLAALEAESNRIRPPASKDPLFVKPSASQEGFFNQAKEVAATVAEKIAKLRRDGC